MCSPEIYKVLEQFSLSFRYRSFLPYTIALPDKTVRMIPISRKYKYGMRASSAVIFLHTLYCLSYLGAIAKKWTTEVSTVQTFVLFFVAFFPLCFLAMHCTISFSPQVAPAIINVIDHFENRIKGNIHTAIY